MNGQESRRLYHLGRSSQPVVDRRMFLTVLPCKAPCLSIQQLMVTSSTVLMLGSLNSCGHASTKTQWACLSAHSKGLVESRSAHILVACCRPRQGLHLRHMATDSTPWERDRCCNDSTLHLYQRKHRPVDIRRGGRIPVALLKVAIIAATSGVGTLVRNDGLSAWRTCAPIVGTPSSLTMLPLLATGLQRHMHEQPSRQPVSRRGAVLRAYYVHKVQAASKHCARLKPL